MDDGRRRIPQLRRYYGKRVEVERYALLPLDPSLGAGLHTCLALDDVFHRRGPIHFFVAINA